MKDAKDETISKLNAFKNAYELTNNGTVEGKEGNFEVIKDLFCKIIIDSKIVYNCVVVSPNILS